MDLDQILKVLESGPGATIVLAVLWLGREIIGKRIKKNEEKTNDLEKTIRENTLAVTELRVEIRHLLDAVKELPEMRKDIDQAHMKIRAMKNGVVK